MNVVRIKAIVRKEAIQILALHSALPGTEAPLWKTLDTSYFARHDPNEIAWHARSLWRHLETTVPVVSARPSSLRGSSSRNLPKSAPSNFLVGANCHSTGPSRSPSSSTPES